MENIELARRYALMAQRRLDQYPDEFDATLATVSEHGANVENNLAEINGSFDQKLKAKFIILVADLLRNRGSIDLNEPYKFGPEATEEYPQIDPNS